MHSLLIIVEVFNEVKVLKYQDFRKELILINYDFLLVFAVNSESFFCTLSL
jgi:hypothetical protein